MQDSFRFLVVSLVLPPGGPLLLLVVGLVIGCWRRRLATALCAAAAALLWLACMPIVAAALVTALGGARPLDIGEAKTADAIVILGGGVRPRALEYGGDTLGRLTLERVRYGAYLARQTGLPVLVTGGVPEPKVRAEADLMREALLHEYGVPVRWADTQARNTRENAANAAAKLTAEGKRRIVLVLHGFDVRRAKHLFEAAGLQVIAAPTQVPRWGDVEASDFLPSATSMVITHYALYEFCALLRDAVLSGR